MVPLARNTSSRHNTTQDPDDVLKLRWIIWLMTLSLALQLAGYVSPWWLVKTTEDSSTAYGLWYCKTCSEGRCQVTTLEEIALHSYYKDMRIGTSLALVAAIVAICLTARRKRTQTARFKDMMSFCVYLMFWCMISGIVSLMSAWTIADNYFEVLKPFERKKKEKYSFMDDTYWFPYSVLLTGLGGIVACIVVLKSLCTIYRLLKQHTAQDAVGSIPQGYIVIPTSEQIPFDHVSQQMPTGYPKTNAPSAYYRGCHPDCFGRPGTTHAYQNGTGNSPLTQHQGNNSDGCNGSYDESTTYAEGTSQTLL